MHPHWLKQSSYMRMTCLDTTTDRDTFFVWQASITLKLAAVIRRETTHDFHKHTIRAKL